MKHVMLTARLLRPWEYIDYTMRLDGLHVYFVSDTDTDKYNQKHMENWGQ